jgi:hypothetical protein
MTDPTPSAHDELSFDRAIPISGTSSAGGDATVQCSVCRRVITESYHTVNGAPVCDSCRTTLSALTAPVREPGPIALALLLGFGASLGGAAIYWVINNLIGDRFQLGIGIVALLSGWLVGKAMRAGSGGRGGRLLQVAAALLTYLSIPMLFLAFQFMNGGTLGLDSLITALLLPISATIGSFPGGLISAVVIGFGIMQAWQLTGTPSMDIQGPFRVGTAPAV